MEWPKEAIDGKIFNVGYENFTVAEIAEKVRAVIGPGIDIVTTPTDYNRSYHVSSEKIRRELNFVSEHSI